ncbi:MAG TPA: glycosyltransferase 87 family protein [Candidatus Dormibacteraeota bacterium]
MRAYPCTLAVLAIGTLLRAALMPVTHGPDFEVWDLASRATLAGSNVYAHHPAYSGGPYAYFPLFLDIELPLQWLALHSGAGFTVLGKLPIVAADLTVALLIADHLARRAHRDALVATGVALFFLNPLVLYNGAFYGRFDSVALALLLLALRSYQLDGARTWRFAVLYALAVAAKTFPIFLLPWLLWRGRCDRAKVLAALVAVVGVLSAPYLLTSPAAFLRDLAVYNGSKLPGDLSWQRALLDVASPDTVRLVTYLLLGAFALALVMLARLDDVVIYLAVAILLFLVASKVIIEQYFLWPMPFLIFIAIDGRSRQAAFTLGVMTAVGMLTNSYFDPLRSVELGVAGFLAATLAVHALMLWRADGGGRPRRWGRVAAGSPAW